MHQYTTVVFDSVELGMTKRAYVYVPQGYATSNTRYPVLYMHDGQNLFDDRIAHMNRGWRIPQVLRDHPDLPKVIIVGIESDGRTRTDQLIPFSFHFPRAKKGMGGQSDAYLEFIVHTVKPYVDNTYRTIPGREFTAIMGSSFGGVNSLYAALTKNDVFSRFASLSGAFHYDFYDPLMELLQETNLSNVLKFHMDTGTQETNDPIENQKYMTRNKQIADVLKEKLDTAVFQYLEVEGGHHHETDWEARFADIMRFLFEN